MPASETTNLTGKSPGATALASSDYTEVKAKLKRFGIAALVLALGFSLPLFRLVSFAVQNQLYSYVLLIPFISVYLGWTKKEKLAVSKPAPLLALGFGITAVVLLGIFWLFVRPDGSLSENDRLSVIVSSFVLWVWSLCAFFLGRKFFQTAGFALGFLIFTVPLPSFAENAISSFLQHSSAETAYSMLKLSGTPVLQKDTILMLPGITLNVAPECSGIRSSLVLLLTSLLAGHFFLQRIVNKTILVVCVVMLGILRNGFRIFTLAQLCIHISPGIIDSPLHHRGGPIFFVISMIPFLFLIWYLRKVESRSKPKTPA